MTRAVVRRDRGHVDVDVCFGEWMMLEFDFKAHDDHDDDHSKESMHRRRIVAGTTVTHRDETTRREPRP